MFVLEFYLKPILFILSIPLSLKASSDSGTESISIIKKADESSQGASFLLGGGG